MHRWMMMYFCLVGKGALKYVIRGNTLKAHEYNSKRILIVFLCLKIMRP